MASRPDYSQLDKEQSTSKSRPTNNQQSESRSTAHWHATAARGRSDYPQPGKEQFYH